MRTVGLFSGIGGLELGFERAGSESGLLAEIDPLCQAVLRRRFKEVQVVGDIRGIDRLPRADVLLAGFPCQPYSQVGPTTGLKDGAWHIAQMFRLLDASKHSPEHVVLENVPFIVHLGNGGALRRILSNLEARGYHWAYRILDTADFGLPQRRRRFYLVASRSLNPACVLFGPRRVRKWPENGVANGFYWTEGNRGIGWASDAIPPLKSGSGIGIPAPPAIWDVLGRAIWTPEIRDAERLQGFRAGWTAVPETAPPSKARQRWRMIGNAVSVPVAQWIAERLITGGETIQAEKRRLSSGPLPKAAYFDGRRRYSLEIIEESKRSQSTPILQFLKYEKQPLSLRATRGFRERYEVSPLAKIPAFIDALHHHEATIADE